MTKNQPKDTVNKRAMLGALIPFAISIVVLGALYYSFFVKDAGPQQVRFATGVPGSATQELIEAIGNQLQSSSENIVVSFVTTSGTEENIRLLKRGDVDVAAIPSDAITRPNFSLIASLYPDTYHFIVHADSNINSLHDLPGKRIAVPLESSSAYRSFWYLIGQYGVSPESVLAKPMTTAMAFEAIRTRKIDAVFYMRPPANRRTRWIAEAARVKILPIDQAAAMALRRDALSPITIPKGLYGGQPPIPAQATPSVAANRILITRSDFPEDVIRELTSVMFEKRRDLIINSRLASFITKPHIETGTILPVHPGALSFYDRDQPTFLQENAEPIGVLFSIFAVMVSGGMWLKRRWEEGQKGRIDVYNLELIQITESARASNSASKLSKQKDKLFDMLSNVVRDLDEDKIDGEGFHFFAFTWEAAFSVINTKEKEMGTAIPIPAEAVVALKKIKSKSA